MEFSNYGDLNNKNAVHSPLFNDKINRKNSSYNSSLNSNESDKVDLGATYKDNVKSLNDELDKIKQEQGLIGNLWDGFKNLTNIGAGSKKVEDAIKQVQNGEIDEKTAREKLEKYQDGQKVCLDVAADMISSIVAVGVFAAAVPTGGTSLAVGLGLSTAIGGGLKVGIKGIDSKLNGREYNGKNVLYDAATGAVNGLFAPITNGLGSSLTKTIGCKLGLEIGGDILEQGAKTTLKSLIVNQSIDVAGGTVGKRAAALGAGMALDGALGGASDNVVRAVLDGEDTEGIVKSGAQGFIGGLIMSPIIGGGFRIMGKLGNKLGKKIKGDTPDSPKTPKKPNKPTDAPDIKAETPADIETDVHIDTNTNLESKPKINVTQPIEVQEARMKELTQINSTIKTNYDKFSDEFIEKAAKEFSSEQYSLLLVLKKLSDGETYANLRNIPDIIDGCSDETAKIFKEIAKISEQISDDRSYCKMHVFNFKEMLELDNSQMFCVKNIMEKSPDSHTASSLINAVKGMNDFQLEVFEEFSHIDGIESLLQIKSEELREIVLSMSDENLKYARNVLALDGINKYQTKEVLEKFSKCTKEEAPHLEKAYGFSADAEIKERIRYMDIGVIEELSNEELDIAKRLLTLKDDSGKYVINGYYNAGLLERKSILDLFMEGHSKSRYELLEELLTNYKTSKFSDTEDIFRLSDKKADFIKRNLYIEGKSEDLQLYNQAICNLNHIPDDKIDFLEKSGLLFVPERGKDQFDALELANLARNLDEKTFEIAKNRNLFTLEKGKGDNKYLLDAAEIADLAQVPEKKWKKAQQIINIEDRFREQFESKDVIKLANLSDDDFEKAKKFFFIEDKYRQFKADDIINLLKLDEKQLDIAHKRGLFRKAYNGDDIYKLSSLTDDEFNRISLFLDRNKRTSKTYSGDELKKIAKELTDEELQRAQTLIYIPERANSRYFKSQFDGREIVELSKLDAETFENLRYFFGGFDGKRCEMLETDEIIKLSKLSCDDLKRAKKLMVINDRSSVDQFQVDDILDLLRLSDSKFKQAEELFYVPERDFQQFGMDEICTLAKLDKKTFEKAKKYFYIDGLEYQPDGKIIPLLVKYRGARSIDALTINKKRELLRDLVKSNSLLFSSSSIEAAECVDCGVLPKNKEEYCSFLPRLVKAIGISTNELSDDVKKGFYGALDSIENPDSAFRKFDFERIPKSKSKFLQIELTYPRAKFISDMSDILAPLTREERNIVCNYFGFEIIPTKKGNIMNGYPVNLNNGVELAKIDNPKLKGIIETMRPLVKEFSENNLVKGIGGNTELNGELNAIIKTFPEFITEIGKEQHGTHDFFLDVHSLKVLQEVINDPRFSVLSDDDKLTLKIASLLHDITKQEIKRDVIHPQESAYDAYYLLQKLNLSEDKKLEIYQIIKDHNWLQKYNVEGEAQRKAIAKDIAYDLRKGSSFEMASILTEADMKAVQREGRFFKKFEGTLKQAREEVGSYVDDIQRSAIPLPQTKIPKASELIVDGKKVKDVVTKLSNGQEIINRVIYLEPDMDLSKYGFKKGLTTNDLNVLIHALDEEDQSVIFQALGQIDSDALLSSSYVTYSQQNYRGFRKQGFVLDVDADDINAGYYGDFGSGLKKNLDGLKKTYLFNGEDSKYRNYISKNLKEFLNLDDKQYVELFNKIKNKSIEELDEEYPEVAKAMRELFKKMEGRKRAHDRQYNEMLITRPKIQAVFDYGKSNDISVIPEFLRQYAADNDIAVMYFGQ